MFARLFLPLQFAPRAYMVLSVCSNVTTAQIKTVKVQVASVLKDVQMKCPVMVRPTVTNSTFNGSLLSLCCSTMCEIKLSDINKRKIIKFNHAERVN